MSISKEEQDLEEYLENEEKDRIEFMEELKNFKSEYNRLKSENESLRERLQRKKMMGSKENSNFENRGKAVNNSNSKSFDFERKANKGKTKNRFSEYESHIQMIQNLQV